MRFLRGAVLTLCIIPCGFGAARADVRLGADTDVGIVCKGPARQELSDLIAPLLEKYLLKATGRETLKGAGGKVAFILEAEAKTWQGLPRAALKDITDVDRFTIEVTSRPKPTVRITGATVLSTGFGVMSFLEEDVGITWLFPGDLGVALPKTRTIVLKDGKREVKPAIVSRLFSGMKYQRKEFMLPFRRKYRKTPLMGERLFYSGWDYYKSLRLHHLLTVHHNMINIFPVKEVKEKYPEVFPIKDGKPHVPPESKKAKGHQNWHPCYTKAKTVEIAAAKARAAFEKGAMVYSLGINDGLRVQCQCPTCKKIGWPESYYQFVTNVANAVKDKYPPHIVGVLVYGDVRHPKDGLKLPENVLAHITGGSELTKWGKRARHLGRYEYFYGDGFYLPSFPLKAMAHNAKLYRSYGVKSFYAETYPVWPFDAPKVYIMSRLFWNPDRDPRALLDRFCAAAYGAAGPSMAKFYLRWTKLWDYLVKPGSKNPAMLCDMGKWRSSAAQFAAATEADYAFAATQLAAAKRLVKGEKETERLRMVETCFEYSRSLFAMNSVVQDVFDENSGVDEKKTFAVVAENRGKQGALEKEIKDHPEWTLAASAFKRHPGWTLDKEIDTALITAIFRLRQKGALDRAFQRALPEDMKVYCSRYTVAKTPGRLKIYNRGVYYAGAQRTYRFEPLQVTKRGGDVFMTNNGKNPVIVEGRTAGNYELHWAALGWSRRPKPVRLLRRIEVDLKGNRGEFTMQVRNNWPARPGDGLPIQISHSFGKETASTKKSVVVEPVSPASPWFNRNRSGKLIVTWQPSAADARIEAAVKFTEIELHAKIERPGPPLPM